MQVRIVSTRTNCTNYFQRLTLESWYTKLKKRLLTDVNNYRHLTNNFIHDVYETDKRTSNRPIAVHLNLEITSAQVVETSVTKNSSFLNFPHPDDRQLQNTN